MTPSEELHVRNMIQVFNDQIQTLWALLRRSQAITLPGLTYYVFLSTDGGSDGTSSTAPSYTYTMFDINGNTLGTLCAPEWRRDNGSFDDAVAGIAYKDATGTWKLAIAFEKESTSEACPPPPPPPAPPP